MNSNKEVTHLNPEERRIIETGIRHGSTKTAIARTIGTDNSTIGKEIDPTAITSKPATQPYDI